VSIAYFLLLAKIFGAESYDQLRTDARAAMLSVRPESVDGN